MRIRLVLALCVFSAAAQASSSLRVDNQVLTIGDSAVRVTELLGKPSHKSHRGGSRSSSRGRRSRVHVVAKDSARGEQWQYRRDDRVTIVTIVDGKVSDIDDRRR